MTAQVSFMEQFIILSRVFEFEPHAEKLPVNPSVFTDFAIATNSGLLM